MRPSLCAAALCVGVALGSSARAAAEQSDRPQLEAVLGRAAWYVLDFIQQFSNVVAEETYVQDSNVALPSYSIVGRGGRGGGLSSVEVRPTRSRHRELRSDFLLVKSGSADLREPFRDVFEVDHVPLRDREERLTKLFLNPSPETLERVGRIQEESTRFNIGDVRRTINNPIFALMMIQPEYQSRFRYTFSKLEKGGAGDVWVVEFKEEEHPTVIQGLPGQDMPAHGRLWIEPDTGRVVKTELRVDKTEIHATLTTVFRVDERFGINVPAEMRENYELAGSHLTGTATYGRFRRFEVTANEEITTPR